MSVPIQYALLRHVVVSCPRRICLSSVQQIESVLEVVLRGAGKRSGLTERLRYICAAEIILFSLSQYSF